MNIQIEEFNIKARAADGRPIRIGYIGSDLLSAELIERFTTDAADVLGEPAQIENPTATDAIRRACETVPGYEQMTSEDLVIQIMQPVRMRPTDRTNLFRLVMQHGGVAGEFAGIWSSPIFVQDLDQALANGWLESTSFMLEAAPLTLSEPTKQAIQLALGELAITHVQAAAEEIGVEAPDQITAQDVDTALGR